MRGVRHGREEKTQKKFGQNFVMDENVLVFLNGTFLDV